MVSLTKTANAINWQWCLKRRPSEADIFHVILFVSIIGRAVDFQTDYINGTNTQALNNITIPSQKNKDCIEINNQIVNMTIPWLTYHADSADYEQLYPTATVSKQFDTIRLPLQTLNLKINTVENFTV